MMNRIVFFLAFLLPILTMGQLAPSYTIDAGAAIQWQKVTTTGTYLIQTTAGLKSFDQATGNEVWTNGDLKVASEDMVSEIPGSSLLMVKDESATSIVDPFNGGVKYTTAGGAITDLNYEKVLYKSSGLLIAGKNGAEESLLQMIDLNSGKMLWEMTEGVGKVVHADEFSDKECLIVTLFKIYRVNSQTGEIVWENSTSAAADAMAGAGALGALFQEMAESAAEGVNFELSYYESKDGKQFILGSEVENKVQSMTTDEVSINYTNNYTLFNKEDGERVWQEPVELEGKIGDLIIEENQVIVLPDDGGKTVINAYDRGTGEGKWGKKGRGIKIKGGIYDHVKVDGGYLIISGSGDKSYLGFLNPSTGELPFDKPVKIGGRVIKTFSSSKGVAYATTEEFDILDPATGDLLLDKSIETKASLVAKMSDENAVLVYDLKDELIRKIDLGTGAEVAFTSSEMEFDGKEEPVRLSIDGDGYLLTSSQNIGRYGTDGSVEFLKYYEAPKESGLRKALLLAQAARAAYISANSYYAAAELNNAVDEVKEEDVVAGAVVEGFGQVYEELGDQASDFAKKTFEQATKRFTATKEGRDYRIVLADRGKENALLQVSKSTGEPMAEISLGKEKEAKYAVDDVLGMVFVRQGDSGVAAYDLGQ
jgi:hypothetical protein